MWNMIRLRRIALPAFRRALGEPGQNGGTGNGTAWHNRSMYGEWGMPGTVQRAVNVMRALAGAGYQIRQHPLDFDPYASYIEYGTRRKALRPRFLSGPLDQIAMPGSRPVWNRPAPASRVNASLSDVEQR